MNSDLRQLEEKLMEQNNFRNLIGIQIEEVREGFALLTLPVHEKLLQAGNIVHGGILSVLVDSVIGTAIRTALNPDQIAVTAEMNLNYFRPAIKGNIFAEGRLVNSGKLLVVGTADIKDENGRLLATGRATYVIKERK